LASLGPSDPPARSACRRSPGYWLDRGIAGWRLDAAYAVPLAFWRTVTGRVRARHPGAWLVGEVIHGDYARYVTEGGLDSVTQYELWKAIWSSLNDRNFFELAWALKRHNAMLATFAPQTFAGNHDVTRLASRLSDDRHLGHALAVLYTVGGVPSVYYGDERGLRAVKEHREGGDDAIRPAYPGEPSSWAGTGDAAFRLHQILIGMRRRHPWLVRARATVSHLTSTALAYTVTGHRAGDCLAVALSTSDQPVKVSLPAGSWALEAGTAQFGPDQALVPPAGWAIASSPQTGR